MANIHESHKKCVICGKVFTPTREHRIYCSYECSEKSKKQKMQDYNLRRRERNIKPVTCYVCGKEFLPNGQFKKLCSRECQQQSGRQHSYESLQRQYVKDQLQDRLIKTKTQREKQKRENAKAVAETAHKLRMQRQREARALGLSYAQYIAINGIKEI